MFQLDNHGKTGFSLVEVMVGLGVLGIFSAIFMTQITNAFHLAQSAALQSEVADIGMYLEKNVHCGKTLNRFRGAAGTIVCPAALSLKNADGANLPSKVGSWNLQAKCSVNEIVVRVEQKNASGIYKKHPLFKADLSFTNSSINPVVGIGAPTQLCVEKFLMGRRVLSTSVRTSALGGGVNNGTCTTVNSTAPSYLLTNEHGPAPFSNPKWQNLLKINRARFALNDRCSEFCKIKPTYGVGGYAVACSAVTGETTCVCYR